MTEFVEDSITEFQYGKIPHKNCSENGRLEASEV